MQEHRATRLDIEPGAYRKAKAPAKPATSAAAKGCTKRVRRQTGEPSAHKRAHTRRGRHQQKSRATVSPQTILPGPPHPPPLARRSAGAISAATEKLLPMRPRSRRCRACPSQISSTSDIVVATLRMSTAVGAPGTSCNCWSRPVSTASVVPPQLGKTATRIPSRLPSRSVAWTVRSVVWAVNKQHLHDLGEEGEFPRRQHRCFRLAGVGPIVPVARKTPIRWHSRLARVNRLIGTASDQSPQCRRAARRGRACCRKCISQWRSRHGGRPRRSCFEADR